MFTYLRDIVVYFYIWRGLASALSRCLFFLEKDLITFLVFLINQHSKTTQAGWTKQWKGISLILDLRNSRTRYQQNRSDVGFLSVSCEYD